MSALPQKMSYIFAPKNVCFAKSITLLLEVLKDN